MSHEVGVWIDHRKAVIVSIAEGHVTTRTLTSDVEPHPHYAGSQEGGGEKKYESSWPLPGVVRVHSCSRDHGQADGCADCGEGEGTLWNRSLSEARVSAGFERPSRALPLTTPHRRPQWPPAGIA